MFSLIESHLPELQTLCQAHRVRRLELIGSAARGDSTATSDLDFLVEFEDMGWQGSSRQYFGFLHGLEDLFRRPIDLIEKKAVTSPLFLQRAQQHADLLYAA